MTKTYAQLTREIQALQASAEKLRAAEVKATIDKLNESIATYGLTADDLRFPGSASASTRRPTQRSSVPSSRTNVSTDAKYGDGQGNTWGGRGPRPAWLRNAILGGRSLESFETSGTPASSKTTQPAKAAERGGKAQAAASKAKLPALYGHPKTGQTWSGRGPKPAWLKQGLKKRGTSIDDFLISARASAPAETSTATPAAVSAQPQVSRERANPADKPAAPAKKSPSEKMGSRAKASPASTPNGAVKAVPATPAKKKSVTDKSPDTNAVKPAAKTAAKKTSAAPSSGTSGVTSSAPAKKTVSKATPKPASKSSPKTAAAPRKNLPSSMAPPTDAAPTASTVPAAAPMPAPPSASVEGRGEAVPT